MLPRRFRLSLPALIIPLVACLALLAPRAAGQSAEEILGAVKSRYALANSCAMRAVSLTLSLEAQNENVALAMKLEPRFAQLQLHAEKPSTWLLIKEYLGPDVVRRGSSTPSISAWHWLPPASPVYTPSNNGKDTSEEWTASRMTTFLNSTLRDFPVSPRSLTRSPASASGPAGAVLFGLTDLQRREVTTPSGLNREYYWISGRAGGDYDRFLIAIDPHSMLVDRVVALRSVAYTRPGSVPKAQPSRMFTVSETVFLEQKLNVAFAKEDFDIEAGIANLPPILPRNASRLTDSETLRTAGFALTGKGTINLGIPYTSASGPNDTASGPTPITADDNPAPAQAAAPEKNAPKTQLLSPGQMEGIVLVESEDGAASGFMTKLRGVDFIVTNLHVLSGSRGIVFKNLRGETIPVTGGVFGAVGSDIALLRIEKAQGSLESAENVMEKAKLGDNVVVVGNRLGGGVATQTGGRVLGVGPTRVEVDAAFEPGNSGSPIFDLETSQVIGVASYAETRKIDIEATYGSDARRAAGTNVKIDKRWFGYRIDSVTRWEAIDLAEMNRQSALVDDYREFSEALLAVALGDLYTAGRHPRVGPLVASFQADYRRAAGNSSDVVRATQSFLRSVRSIGESAARDLQRGSFYDYYRTCLYWEHNITAQTEFRSRLIEALRRHEANAISLASRLFK